MATYTITLTGGAAPPTTATLTVNRVAPQVTSVSPASALTPQSLQPGTLVTINGSGFCQNSRVTFGNNDATATPSKIAADGTSMTVAVPPLGTEDPVTVSSDGQTATSSASLHVNSYRNINGYPFHNYTPAITYPQMTEAFGAAQTETTLQFNPCCLTLTPLCFIGACTITETFPNPFALLLQTIANDTMGNPSAWSAPASGSRCPPSGSWRGRNH